MASVINLGKCIFLNSHFKSVVTRHSFAAARCTALAPSHTQFSPQISSSIFPISPLASIQFRALEPLKSENADSKITGLSKLSKFNLINGFPRTFFWRRKPEKEGKPKNRIPKLILLQNPLTWLMIKIDFSVLRNIWDPSFAEKDFKFGTKQMASVINLGKCIFLNSHFNSVVTRHSFAAARCTALAPWHTQFSPQISSSIFPISPLASIQFRALEPLKPENADSKIIDLSKLSKFNLVNGFPRTFFWRRKPEKEGKPKKRIPKLILLQNPLTWLMIKIKFSVLRNTWDPSFAEKDFKFGTKQAISRVTNVISDGQYSELNGLLTKAARVSLMRELDRNWSEKQRALLALQKEDIQISSPRKVYFIRIADKKFCDVDMAFLALKWAPINSIEALIFTEIFARFHREYTPHSIPEWTIAYFKVTRFEVLRQK